MARRTSSSIKVLAENRQARHNYHLLETYEAGLVLTGTEVKAARAGKVQLRDAYATVENGEAWLHNAHFGHYGPAGPFNHDPLRPRKLLLHKHEIKRLMGKIQEKGLTLIPTKLYLKNGLVKCELALAKGKKIHDKREALRMRELEREAEAALRKYR